MKIISVFNNKGGVGKSTLSFHLGHALNQMGHKTLLVDLDPQCNLTIFGISPEKLEKIWEVEEPYIEDFEEAFSTNDAILKSPRSIHFILKPTEEGQTDFSTLPPPLKLNERLDLIPGRLSIHQYENKLAERWSGVYQGDNLAIRTITKIRDVCTKYSESMGYDYVIIDTSPSLGILNKTIISTVDGFFVPVQPDMFSLYGIRNIGRALTQWQTEFNTIYGLISGSKRGKFPENFVQFMGFTIYNAKKYSGGGNKYDLAAAHFHYVNRIPIMITEHIKKSNRLVLTSEMLETPIGGKAVMHTHNTFPSIAQALNCPIWMVPSTFSAMSPNKRKNVKSVLPFNQAASTQYKATENAYIEFAKDLLTRLETIGNEQG